MNVLHVYRTYFPDTQGGLEEVIHQITRNVVPHGAEDRELQEAKQQFGKDFFLFIGVLRYYKGLHILIEAARLSGLPCIIVGRGPMEQELKQQVQEGHMDNVRFLSHVDDKTKMALLRLCRAVVFPSHLRSEAFGVTLLEGAMSGKPLVSTEIGTGTSYVNLDGETGMVIPPGDPRRLADAMQKLSADPALCQRFGNAARQRYEQMFTGQQMGTQYFRLYQRLVSA